MRISTLYRCGGKHSKNIKNYEEEAEVFIIAFFAPLSLMATPEQFPSAQYWGQSSSITSSMTLMEESNTAGRWHSTAWNGAPWSPNSGQNLWDQGDVQIPWPGKRSQRDRVQEAFGKYSWAHGVNLGDDAVGAGPGVEGPLQFSLFCFILCFILLFILCFCDFRCFGCFYACTFLVFLCLKGRRILLSISMLLRNAPAYKSAVLAVCWR